MMSILTDLIEEEIKEKAEKIARDDDLISYFISVVEPEILDESEKETITKNMNELEKKIEEIEKRNEEISDSAYDEMTKWERYMEKKWKIDNVEERAKYLKIYEESLKLYDRVIEYREWRRKKGYEDWETDVSYSFPKDFKKIHDKYFEPYFYEDYTFERLLEFIEYLEEETFMDIPEDRKDEFIADLKRYSEYEEIFHEFGFSFIPKAMSVEEENLIKDYENSILKYEELFERNKAMENIIEMLQEAINTDDYERRLELIESALRLYNNYT